MQAWDRARETMESVNGLQFNHCPLNHCPLLHGFAHLTVYIIFNLHSGTAVSGRALKLGGGGGQGVHLAGLSVHRQRSGHLHLDQHH